MLLVDNVYKACQYEFEGMGVRHTSVELIQEGIDLIQARHEGLIIAYPDSGYFRSPYWDFEEVISPADLSSFASRWKNNGVNVIGGC